MLSPQYKHSPATTPSNSERTCSLAVIAEEPSDAVSSFTVMLASWRYNYNKTMSIIWYWTLFDVVT
jgi:hypothetical protein